MAEVKKDTPQEQQRKEMLSESVMQEYTALYSNRVIWESHWEEVANYVLPDYRNTLRSNAVWTPGIKKAELQFDSTANMALMRFTAILDSLLTPRNNTWHMLRPKEEALQKDKNVTEWMEQTNQLLFNYRYAPLANYGSQNQQYYMSLGAFGTAGMFVDALDDPHEKGLRYKNLPLGEMYLKENHQGQVDGMVRAFWLTGRQAIQKWGEDKLPEFLLERMKSAAQQREAVLRFKFLHMVRPRTDYDPSRIDAKGKRYESIYTTFGSSGAGGSVGGGGGEGGPLAILSEGGFNVFPFPVSRYIQAPGEIYGRGPAMEVLPAIKTLNEQKRIMLKQGHRTVDPVLLTHDDGILDELNLKPGATNRGGVNSDGRLLVQPLPIGNVQIGKELMDDERSLINDAFLVSLFQILTEAPQMTATEVIERTREKGILLAPMLGRQQSEYLGPMIDREIDVLMGQGLLPPMPQALIEAGAEYEVRYDSPLTRAQRADEVAGIMRSVESTLNIINITQDHSPLDWYDWDKIVPEVASVQAVPSRWMRDIKAVMAIRKDRSDQQQQQQDMQAAPGQAALISASAKAKQAGVYNG